MRLSVILELLLIFLLIAFAAYGRVIERTHDGRAIAAKKPAVTKGSATATSLKQATDNVNKYCVCNENICNCCRDFHIPLVQLSGPGCASLQYLQDDKLAMQLSIGDNILSSNIVNGKNPKPVCVALPGGFSKFCGKIYSIKREADKNFKACLGLELRSSSELEASLRVSCFRFGPDGLKLRPAEPIPASLSGTSAASSDDDYDFFGLGDDDEDDDDDDEEEEEEEEEDDDQKVSPENNSVAGAADSAQQGLPQDPEEQEEEEDDDILGLGALFDIFAGDDEETTKKKKATTPTPLPPSFAIPILSWTTTAPPVNSQESLVNKNPIATSTSSSTSAEDNAPIASDGLAISNSEETPIPVTSTDELNMITQATEKESSASTEKIASADATPSANVESNEKTSTTAQTNKITGVKVVNVKIADKTKLKKVVVIPLKKKVVSSTTQSVNAIKNTLKPQEEEPTTVINEDTDDDYEYDSQSEEVEDSDEEKVEDEKAEEDEDKKQVNNDDDEDDEEAEDNEDEDDETAEAVVDDDDDEEEEAVLSALMDDEHKGDSQEGNKDKKKNDKSNSNKTKTSDGDYDDLAELLARKHNPSGRTVLEQSKNLRTVSRQSKVMRL